MSRSNVIEIDGKEYELYFSTWALLRISDRCGGDIEKLGDWLGKGKTGEMLSKYNAVITDLANGAVTKHNTDIVFGFEQGEKKELFPDDYFINVMQVSDIMKYREEIFRTLNMGTDYEIPEGVEVQEKDPELAELEREKNLTGRGEA